MNKMKDIIKEERDRLHLSQGQLGEKLGVSQKAISKYEVGNATPPPDVIELMADVFGVSTDYLFGRTETRDFVGHSEGNFYFYFPKEAPPLAEVATRRGLSLEELSKKTGLSLETLQNCYDKYVPAYKELIVLATALATSVDYLLGRTDEIDPPNKEELALIRYYRGLSEIDQHLLLGKAAELIKNANDGSVAADPAEAPAKMAK